MQKISWSDFYDNFWECCLDDKPEQAAKKVPQIEKLGASDEVAEIVCEIASLPAGKELLKRAIAEKLAFSADELIDISIVFSEELTAQAAYNSRKRITAADVEELYGNITDESLRLICQKQGLPLPKAFGEPAKAPNQAPAPRRRPTDAEIAANLLALHILFGDENNR